MTDTKQKIITLADQLIKTRGYNAFSYADIAGRLQIKNAAIHYHFPNKCDLGIAVLKRELEGMHAAWAKWEGLPEDVQLQKFMQTFGNKNKESKICLMGSLTPDYATFTPLMQEKVAEMCTDIGAWLTGVLERGRNKKLFHFEGLPYDRALIVVTSLQSSLLLGRVIGSKAYQLISKQLLKDILEPAHP